MGEVRRESPLTVSVRVRTHAYRKQSLLMGHCPTALWSDGAAPKLQVSITGPYRVSHQSAVAAQCVILDSNLDDALQYLALRCHTQRLS